MRRIEGFTGPYRFLSNFFVEPDGSHVEGEYQQQKVLSATERARFHGLTPAKAKALGRKVQLRPGWDAMRQNVMLNLLLKKFMEHEELKAQLCATGDAYLEETNDWGDRYWGVCDGVGQNHLGKTLMKVRDRLCGASLPF